MLCHLLGMCGEVFKDKTIYWFKVVDKTLENSMGTIQS